MRVCVTWQFDIDDILRVAEQRSVEELKNSATDQLLSQFKVTFFVSDYVFCFIYERISCFSRRIFKPACYDTISFMKPQQAAVNFIGDPSGNHN